MIDEESITAQEREILEGFIETIVPAISSATLSGVLIGAYPDTVLRVSASKHGQTRVREWSIWDGTMTAAAPGVPPGTEEYLQLLFSQVSYWMTAPYWRESSC